MKHVLEMAREHLVASVLLVLLIVEMGSLFYVGPFGIVWPEEETAWQEDVQFSGEVLRLSEIDGPRIDDGAAMIIVPEETLPGELWVFLLLAYGALLVFNFSYTFEKVRQPQWGWEVIYTLFVLWGWSLMDAEQQHLWFPFMIVKLGLILFALYVSLLEKRNSHVDQPKLFQD